MLKEVVLFAENIEKTTLPKKAGRSKEDKLIVIFVNSEIERVEELKVLEDDFKGLEWLEGYRDKIRECSFSAGNNNKALGSVSGLLTFSPFSFKLTQKNFDDFIKKFKKTKLSERQEKVLPEKVVSDWRRLGKIVGNVYETLTSLKKEEIINAYVLICPGKDKFEEWMNYAEELRSIIFSQLKASDKSVEGKCPSCSKTDKLNVPSEVYSFNTKKPYLEAVTKKGKIKYPYSICQECRNKISSVFKFLKDYRIKFFPLITKFIYKEKYFNFLNKEGENKFKTIFEEYAKGDKKEHLNFYLVINTRNYFSVDYVNGYDYVLGDFRDYFKQNPMKKDVSRCDIEIKLKQILGMSINFDDYFEDKIKSKVIYTSDLIYSYRSKLFDYVYRGKSTLSWRDVSKIVCQRLAKDMKNEINREWAKGWLNTYFNFKNDFRGLEKMDKENKDCGNTTIDFEKIKEDVESEKEFMISNDETWAYLAGQVAYYLVYQSEADSKSYALLEPFSNAVQDKVVKIKLIDLFKKYKHKVGLNHKKFNRIMCAVLKYDLEKKFSDDDIKPIFYAGVFADNIIFYKKGNKEVNEDE